MGKRRVDKINRREFLKKAAVTAGALGASNLIPGYYVNAAEPIRIGVTADMTGALADFGYWISKSARAATQRVNASGGIAGREVQLIVEDTESKPPTGVRKTRKLIQRDKADFIIGSHHSGIGLAVAPIFNELKTIGFPSGNATPITGKKGNPYLFRLNESVLHEVWSTAEWAVKTMGKRWTLMGADMAWGQDQVRQWDKRIKFYGGEVIDKILIPLGTDNWVPYLSRIDQKRTQVIFSRLLQYSHSRLLAAGQGTGHPSKIQVFRNLRQRRGI